MGMHLHEIETFLDLLESAAEREPEPESAAEPEPE